MLGLATAATVRELFALLLAGDGPAVLALVERQHAQGIDPVALFRGLLETVHGVTRARSAARSIRRSRPRSARPGRIGRAG